MVNSQFYSSKRSILILVMVLFAISPLMAAPWLGFSFKKEPYQNQMALVVEGVHPSSGALAAGLSNGDKVISVNEKQITSVGVVQDVLKKKKVGESISIRFIRDGKEQTAKIKLTDRPDDISNWTGSAIGSKMVDFGQNFYANGEKRQAKPKVILLDFWATWCMPCRQTLPILERLYNKYAKEGLEVVGISKESLSVLKSFYQKNASVYPLYRDADFKFSNHYRITSVPTLMLLDQNGYIQKVWAGVPNEAQLDQIIREKLR
ncbi:MAG TPA: thioredoxin-like domain-containing protein [Fibrobacteraceae bacterium]|nr:thioredoxin-like domain-containing protein [Fibrobacteraceae bacterium]HQB64651.1 thioredoxin-like domain-containing protein [Fibrobacteraceae bacterium]